MYAYTVKGTNYISSNYDVDGPYDGVMPGGEARVAAILKKFPAGSVHTIHYKPND